MRYLTIIILIVGLSGCVSQQEESDLMVGWARVSGDSMLPTLIDGDVVHVMPVPFDKLEDGDIVVYRGRHGEIISHRIETRSSGSWYAKGDNNKRRDRAYVTEANYLGYVYLEDSGRKPVALAQSVHAIGIP